MNFEDKFAHIASIVGEKSRAIMLWNLTDGRAYTAGELAVCADISRQSASNHLTKMMDADLLALEKQGRHRYYRLARPEVAYALEAMANFLPSEIRASKKEKPPKKGVEYARTCYDHLAGKVGVEITEALVEKDFLEEKGKNYCVTPAGEKWFESIGINIEKLQQKNRTFARQCLDRSERKHHLAGALGAALCSKMLENDWIRKKRNSREVLVTYKGRKKLSALLDLNV
jgi:DNA-binding transcriptional ArsR family regulator